MSSNFSEEYQLWESNGGHLGTLQNGGESTHEDTTASQDNNSYYQSGYMSAGNYANVSYNVDDSSTATVTQYDSTPYAYGSDTWQVSATLVGTLNGATETSAASLNYEASNVVGESDTGSGTSSSSSSPTWAVPGLSLALSAPDSSVVPVLGMGGPMGVSSPNLNVVGATSEVMSATGVLSIVVDEDFIRRRPLA